ncbi:Uncharacterised protein [Salmonella enterica subsp. enterica]|uniref:Uncharacterized protein n=1 Tax=Salmonella enterica I TaxID=59201 RepID=A0A379UPI3_SALET|nr:Uncharacterised protein [Salmonella enterica subsp. enterica]
MAVNMKLKPKTPKKVNAAIKNILNELGVKESPVYLPLTLSENSRAGYCFNNCEDYVKSKMLTLFMDGCSGKIERIHSQKLNFMLLSKKMVS